MYHPAKVVIVRVFVKLPTVTNTIGYAQFLTRYLIFPCSSLARWQACWYWSICWPKVEIWCLSLSSSVWICSMRSFLAWFSDPDVWLMLKGSKRWWRQLRGGQKVQSGHHRSQLIVSYLRLRSFILDDSWTLSFSRSLRFALHLWTVTYSSQIIKESKYWSFTKLHNTHSKDNSQFKQL